MSTRRTFGPNIGAIIHVPDSLRRGLALLAVGWFLGTAAESRAQTPQLAVDARIPHATRQIVERAVAAPGTRLATGSTVVAEGEVLSGSIVQLGGTILLEGRVEGDVLAVDSEVTLKPSAAIGGRLTVLAGRFYGTTMADLGAETMWLPEERLVVQAGPDTVHVRYVPPERPFPIGLGGILGLVPHEYNGVDGLAFGVEVVLRDLEGQPPTELRGGPLFRTERMEEVGWRVEGFREFSRLNGLRAGARAYSTTDTGQRWHRPDFGNSVAALFFANDDRAYHDRTGYELWLERSWVLTPVTLRLGWRDDEFDPLQSATPLVLFGEDEDWPINPAVDPGRGRALALGAIFDLPLAGGERAAGLHLHGRYDHWGFGGDFEFDWGLADGRVRVPVGASFASIRVAAGGRLGGRDTLAPQFLHRLGGAGTVIGYDGLSEELTGDRMAIANLGFHWALPGARFRQRIYLVGLADIGDAWFADESIEWNTGLGAGLAGRGRRGYVGVYAGYGLESEEWHAYAFLRPWF